MIKITQKGDFSKTFRFLQKAKKLDIVRILERYGEKGVSALREATPKDTGRTADSWSYEIHNSGSSFSVVWKNSNLTSEGIPIVILLQYGHGTGSGGYVQGRDFINPALRGIFDDMAREAWEEVTR